MNTILKKVVSLILCFVLVIGYVPTSAIATETGETVTTETTAVTTETTGESSEETEAPSESTELLAELSELTDDSDEEEKSEKELKKEEKEAEKAAKEEEKVSKKETESSTEPSTEATIPATETTVPVTGETVPTTEETVPETTEATVPETTEETVPETTVETRPGLMMMAAAPKAAPEHVDAAIFFSDLHTSSYDYKQSTVEGIMTALKNTGLSFSSVTSAGDAFSVNQDNGKYTGKTRTITGYIQSVLGDVPVNYVWSDHDRYAVQADDSTLLDKTSRLVYGAGSDGVYGTDDDGNYYVYSLSMGDLCSYDRYNAGFNYSATNNNRASKGFTATVPEAIENFEADAAKLKKDRPLFIVSHQPLFDNRNDNAWAEDWFDAINAVAADMDVAFFYGHNHKYDTGSDYYYAKGSTMPVATADMWGWDYDVGEGYLPSMNLTSENKILNFTHMCAGYMAPSSTGSTSNTTREGVAVAVTIYEDSISYVTYNAGGVYTGSYALNETVKRDHLTATEPEIPEASEPTEPSEPETSEPVEDTNGTGITVTASGVTAVEAEVLDNAQVEAAVAEKLTNYVAYDIVISGEFEKAVVSLPMPANVTNPAVYYIPETGEPEQMPLVGVENSFVSFETTHNSTYVVGQAKAGQTSDVVTPGATIREAEKVTVYKLVSSPVSGKQYLIVNSDTGTGYGLDGDTTGYATAKFEGGTDYYSTWDETTKTGTAFAAGSDVYLTTSGAYEWTAGSGSFSIGYDSNSSIGNFVTNYTYSLAPANATSDSWSLSGNNLSISLVTKDSWFSSDTKSTYYLTNNGSAWSMATSGAANVYFYEPVTIYKVTENSGSSTVTYGINITVDGQAASTLTVNGVTADEPSKTLGYAFYSNPAGHTPSNGKLTWSKTTNNGIADVDANGQVTFTGKEGTETIQVSYTWTAEDEKEHTVSNTLVITTTASGSGGDSGEGGDTEVEVPKNNYPEYPDEGAVKVNKTATGIDFQSSGIAQVEVSASGVPLKKGADVIVMLDTSSSMTKNEVSGSNGKMRSEVLEESLKNLITYFKTPGEDGAAMDLRVAIADFNGYYGDNSGGTSGTPYDRTSGDYVKNGTSNGSGYNQPSEARVYTGTKNLTAGAFVNVGDLAATYTLNYTSGTNYDYAFDAIYQLGTAIKTENRDLFVIFMSDGASLQWNYFGTQNGYTKWNNWLAGTWDADDLTTTNLNSTEHSYFYDLNDHDGDGHINEHRMANAIKGDPSKPYEIIRKSNAGLPDGTLTKVNGKEHLYTVPGLGATMFTINFDAKQDGQITVDSIDKALASTASDQTGTTKYYYKVTTAAELQHAFDAIGAEIAYAAYNARFVDQMGDDFDLQMETVKYAPTGSTEKTETITPKIEIITYDIYTRQDFEEKKCLESQIGDRKGTFKVLETVTFSADGTAAYSDQIDGGTTNILADGTKTGYVKGVIYAKTFLYNTNPTAVEVGGVSIPTGTNANGTTTGSANMLPSETFYWKMGTVQTSELAMRYYVYLEGSMEGTKEGGSYPTNEFATLYYDNYLGNPCKKDTVSPVMAWKEANVSYAFYLVDENGNIIANQTTGQTGSFANKIAVTNPVVYETIKLNNLDKISSIEVASTDEGVLPAGYELYDSSAVYTVRINSNTTGSWKIEKGSNKVASTYVTQYKTDNASAYSNALTNSTVGDDYTHTIVWFAVVWKTQALPDSVVVDYGLPVDISVLTNDMFGENGKLAGVGAYSDSLNLDGHDPSLVSGFGTSYTGTYGTAKADTTTGKVRYTLNTMEMNGYEKFAYAVNYTGNENAGYYYDTVTVIPATTIYYEDSFLTFKKYNADGTENGTWDYEGTSVEGATQDEDRPGQYSLTDANNIYGYDSVNLGMSTFSLGQARKVHVDANSYATATFTFTGTGFDVISMTSNTTGVIAVQVTDAAGQPVKSYFVNTYYGYTKNEAGEWEATPDVEAAIYQVPVLQVEGLTYGQYSATITATYTEYLDKTTAAGYDLYMDAIRIYDPANGGAADGTTDTTIEDAYKADGEGWPSYIELRNKIITANSFDNVANDALTIDMEGLVFIDGDASVGDAQLSDYTSYGPNNEVYLAPGQSVAFLLNTNVKNAKNENIVANIHIGISSANGATGTYTITNIAQTTNSEAGVTAGDYYGAKTDTINTTTDMYYDLTGWKGDIIVISNTGDLYNTKGIISLTNIKATYTENPNGAAVASEDDPNAGIAVVSEEVETTSNEVRVYMTPAAAKLTLRSLNASAEEEIPEETIPDESIPEESVPETSVPETTVPEETENEETIPETTVPEKSEQEQIEEAVKEVVTTVVNTVVNALKNLLSKWFR